MIGMTFGQYLARHFMRYTLLIFGVFLVLILAVDMVELSRGAPVRADGTSPSVFLIALFRVPDFAENVIPFAVLFAAASSLSLLNRKLELVVARASGISVWQFLLPYFTVAVLLGLFSALVYNPLSLKALEKSRDYEARVFSEARGSFINDSSNFWLRVAQPEGDVIIRAGISQQGGRQLSAVSVYRFDAKGAAIERLDAKRARFIETNNTNSRYVLEDVIVTTPGKASSAVEKRDVPVVITATQLQNNTSNAASVGFWSLTEEAERARLSGRNEKPYLTRQQALLSQPLLFIAMVLVAACVSLRFARFGQSGNLILGGVLAGFVLYVASEIVLTFGSNGFVSPYMAAWSPAVVATLIGITVLLHQEDG